MDDSKNTSTEGTGTSTEGTQQGRTFSQDDVNRIVQERLNKERAKTENGIAEKEKELARREFLLNAREELGNRGYPESILDALNASDADSFRKSLDILDSYIKERETGKPADKLEQQKACFFTAPLKHQNNGDDDIRRAMGLH